MKKKIIFLVAAVFLIGPVFVTSCDNDDNQGVEISSRTKGIFTVLADDTTIEMNGVISSSSLKNFNNLYDSFPNINKINIEQCDGSEDDETNLLLSKRVHDLNINTHLLNQGLIASGGVDFFLQELDVQKEQILKLGYILAPMEAPHKPLIFL